MNENQLQELYNRISAADATYSKRYTFDQFKTNMQDQAYVGKLSSWASSRGIDIPTEQPPVQQPPVQQRPVANAYNAEDLLKKKSIQSVSSSDQSSSASTSEQNEEEPKPLYNVDSKRYETKLPQQKEQEFQKWLDSQVKLGRISQGDYDFYKRNGYGYNYDFRAAFLNKDSGGISPVDNQWHWSDYGKKPNHPTFSVESVYNMRDGLQGGVWGGKEGEDFMAPFKPQPAVSEGTRAGVPPIQQQQKVQQQIQQREQKRNLPQFVTEQVEGVTPELMSKEEEFVVPQLNYKFGPLGFKFEESGITNNVTVTAPNGKKKDIPIPTNLYQDLTTGNPVLSVLGKLFGYEEGLEKEGAEPASELKMFIRENAQNIKDLAKYESMYRGEKVKYETTKQAEDSIKSASDEYNAINAKINSYSKESAMADKMFEELNKVPEDQRDDAYNKRYDEAIDMKQRAIANANSIDADRYYASSVKYKDVEKSVGDYFMMKSEQGTWIGALTRGELRGTGSLLAGAVDLGVMAGNVAMYPYMAGQPEMVRQRDELRRGITNFFVDNFGDKSTTEQWTAAMSEKNVANAAVLGLGSMAPALAAGAIAGPIAGGAVFAAQGYNDTMIEAEDAGIPPGERELVAVPVGITMGVVSELGLGKVPGVKQFANRVTAKAMGALGADFTATTFRNFVQNEVKSRIARGALVAGKGFVHGFETGVKMEAGTIGIKELYNQVKDRKDEGGNYMKSFNTPESIGDFFSHLVESGISMGIGGTILASPEVLKSAAAKNNFNGISDSHLEMFDLMSKDDMFNSLTTLKVKQDIIDGKITKEQGELQLRSYQELASLMKSLPDGLTNAQKRKSLGLLQEKVLLKSQIEKGDPALTKKQRDRVTEIDNFLGQISEGKYSEVSEIKPEDVKVTIGDKVMWNPDAAKEMEQWDVAEVKDDSVILTKGEETQTIPLKELQQHITDTYAVQKPTTNESVLRAKQSEMGLQEVVEGDQELDVVKTEEQKRKEEIETALAQPDNGKGTVTIGDQLIERTALETELADINKKMEDSTKAAEPEKPKNEIEDLLDADTSQKDNLKKVYDFLDRIDKNLTEKTKFGAAANEFMRFFPLETLRLVVKGVKVLVEGGMKLRDAIKKVSAENKVSEDDVKSALSYAKEKGDLLELPDYEKTINEIQDYADFATNKKEYWSEEVKSRTESYNKYEKSERYRKGSLTEQRLKEDIQEAKNELKKYTEGNLEEAMKILEESETYKSASDVQRESLVRDMRERFELKEKKAPKPEELFGDVADINKAMEEIKFEFEDAEKSKIYLEDKYEKAKAAYDESVNKGKPSEALKRNMDKAKAEIEEYKTKNIEAAKKALRKTETYKKASPERQQKMEKYLEDRFLRRKEVLPTKLFEGAKEGGKVTTTNKRIWAEKLKSFFNGIKSHANALAKTRNAIKESINDLAKGGKITAKQAATLIERASKVKIFNEESITKFVDYASKLFADADYASKLNNAKSLRKSVSKLSRNKETNLDLKEMGERFAEIDPSMVDNIDLYNENATKIADAMKASLGRKLGETVVIEKMSDYVKETMDAQIEKMTEIKQKQLEELGIDATDMSYSQIVELMKALKEDKPLTDEQEKAARDIAKKQFEMNAAIINEMIESGKDPFTGDDIEFTDTQKRLVKEFMDMNLSYLSVKEANAAAAALDNFITNGSTAKMSVMADRYKGLVETKELYDKGVRAKSLKSIMLLGLFPKTLGRIWAEKIGSVTNVIDRIFRSPGIAAEVSKVIGLTDVINGHAKGVRVAQDRIKAFIDKFNKGDFNTAENDVERGMYADLLRSTEGTPEQIAAEFNAKKESIKEDIKKLKESKDDDLIKKGELHQKVYDKIVKDSNNAKEVKSKMNEKNAEAIDWWINEWSSHFGPLSELLESVYNRRLGKDLNYTPRTIKYIKSKPREIGEIESVFMANRGGIYTGETGVIMEATKNKPPRDMYVDYSFNKNMSESLYDAMIDINTASKVARLKSAVDSPFFQAMFEGSKDYDVLRNVISSYVRDMRHKTIYDQSELSSGIRAMNNIATLGVNMSLSGVTQPAKQVVPMLGNTMTNAGVVNTMSAIAALTRGGLDFVNRSGRDVAVRGQESMVNIKDVNSMIKNASESLGGKSIDAIENANKAMLKYTLKNPDVWVAKASWLAYYEKYLRDNKLYETEAMKMTENESKLLEKYNKEAEEILNDPNAHEIDVDWAERWKKNPFIEQRESVKFWEREYEQDPSESNKNAVSESKELYSALLKSRGIQVGKLSIDYTTHKLNEKAADYADSQVRRQQNVSLRELQGGMFKSQNTFEKLFVQTLMPFSNFRMNQKSRMGNDMFTIFSDVATKQEKLDAARSLAGTGVEAAMFNGLRVAIGYGLWQVANALIGNEPTEEQEDKYMNTMIKSSATGVVNDFFSPLPPFDAATSYGANMLFDITQDLADIEDKDKLNVFDGMSKQDITKAFGLLGVVPSRIGQTAEAINLWSTGDFKDDFGRVKKLNDESRDAMGNMALISLLSLSGLGLAETNTIVKDAIKIIKKGAKVESKLTPQEQKDKAEGKKERQETKKEKIKSINVLIDQQNDPDVIRELLKIRKELEKGMDKKERRNEKKKMEELLQGYDSKSDMKRYDPDLYERTFGEGTKYYMENRGEIEAEKKLREYMREQEDIERNYTPKPKRQRLRFENKRTLRFRRTGP